MSRERCAVCGEPCASSFIFVGTATACSREHAEDLSGRQEAVYELESEWHPEDDGTHGDSSWCGDEGWRR